MDMALKLLEGTRLGLRYRNASKYLFPHCFGLNKVGVSRMGHCVLLCWSQGAEECQGIEEGRRIMAWEPPAASARSQPEHGPTTVPPAHPSKSSLQYQSWLP